MGTAIRVTAMPGRSAEAGRRASLGGGGFRAARLAVSDADGVRGASPGGMEASSSVEADGLASVRPNFRLR